GRPEWGEDPRFATLKARAVNVGEDDEMVSAWTRGGTRAALMATLKGADGLCGFVKDLPGGSAELRLWTRGMGRGIDDPCADGVTIRTSQLRMNGDAPVPDSLAPRLGADTDDFLRTELGLDAAAIESLRTRKVI